MAPCFLVALLLAPPIPESGEFEVSITDIVVPLTGEAVPATVRFTARRSNWQGISLGVRHDPAVVELLDAEVLSEGTWDDWGVDFRSVHVLAEGAICGLVITMCKGRTQPWCTPFPLPPVADLPTLELLYRAAPGAADGDVSRLRFVDDLGSPQNPTVVVAEGVSIRPVLRDGTARIVAHPPEEPFIRCDANGDGRVDIGDPVFSLAFQFYGGPAPAHPYPEPGFDPTHDELRCPP